MAMAESSNNNTNNVLRNDETMIARGGYGYVVAVQSSPVRTARKYFTTRSQYCNEVMWNRKVDATDDVRKDYVVKFYDVGYDTTSHLVYIDMQLACKSLYNVAFNKANLETGCPEITTCATFERLLSDVLNGLDFLHSPAVGMLHNDVKPENILLKVDGTYAYCDFGFATQLDGTNAGSRQFGTIAYAAPEYFDPWKLVDGAVDVFALGITLLAVTDGYWGVPSMPSDEELTDREAVNQRCNRYFKTQYQPPVALGRNVKRIQFKWQYSTIISSMVHPTSRPTCAQLLRLLRELLQHE
jgi:serine/threonine protein kinase